MRSLLPWGKAFASEIPMKLRQRDLCTRLLRGRPLLLAAMLYLFGCIIAYYFMPPRMVCYAGMALPALLFAFLRKRKPQIALALLMLACVPLGCVRFEAAWHQTSPLPDQRGAQLSGRIASIPVWNPETERSICKIEDLTIDSKPVRGALRLYLRGDTALLQTIELGSAFNARLTFGRRTSPPTRANSIIPIICA